MAKKSFGLSKILLAVAVLLGVVAFCMLFAPAVSVKALVGDDAKYSGFQVAFGYTDKSTVGKHTVSTKILVASAYILPVITLVVSIAATVVALLGKGGKLMPIIAGVCFVVTAVLFFLATSVVTPETGKLSGDFKKETIKSFRENCSLGVGAIMGGILSILAGAANCVAPFLKK